MSPLHQKPAPSSIQMSLLFTKTPNSSLYLTQNPKAKPTMVNKPSSRPTNLIKFLCSYNGKILPRLPDGKLRYCGGTNHVVAVPRSISLSQLKSKLAGLCGAGTVAIRCQLPTEDLDTLITVMNDEDLADIIKVYDTAPTPLKIRAILTLLPGKKPPSSSASTSKSSSSNHSTTTAACAPMSATARFSMPRAPQCAKHHAHANPSRLCHVNNVIHRMHGSDRLNPTCHGR